jgi:hypothetical protein
MLSSIVIAMNPSQDDMIEMSVAKGIAKAGLENIEI